jgi:hypothetical protein
MAVDAARRPAGRAPFDGAGLPTQVVQASGIVALIWAYAGLVLGLLIGIRPIGRPRRSHRLGRSVVLTLHRQLNLVVLALVMLHALVFALAMPGGSLLVAFVPGSAARSRSATPSACWRCTSP